MDTSAIPNIDLSVFSNSGSEGEIENRLPSHRVTETESLSSVPSPSPSPFKPKFDRSEAPQLVQHQFKPGVSGNPKGRPKKNPNAPATVKIDKRRLVRTLFENGAEDVIKQTIEQAKNGDVKAQALVLQYIVPAHKTELTPVDLELPDDAPLEDRLVKLAAFVTAGKISPDSAAQVSRSLRDLIEGAKILEANKKLDQLTKVVSEL